jgi:hypothetical protein
MVQKKKTSKSKDKTLSLLTAIEKLQENQNNFRDEVKVALDQQVTAIRKDVLQYVAPLFENIHDKLHKEIHGVRVIIEQLDKKFEDALIPTQMTTEHAVKIKDHTSRIENIETDVSSLKTVLSAKNN